MTSRNMTQHKVRISPTKAARPKPDAKLDRTVNYINGNKKPENSKSPIPVGPRTDEETEVIISQIKSTVPSTACSVRAARKIGSLGAR